MNFIDSYERQLVEAAERRRDARLSRRARRWLGGRAQRRGAALALAALVVAVPATAATVGGWDPFEDSQHNPRVGKPTASERPVDGALKARLGVLRRPQTPADRGAATDQRLRDVGREFRGAQVDGIRVLDRERTVVLVPFEQMPVPRDDQGRPLPGFGGPEQQNVACVFRGTSEGFTVAGCHDPTKIERGLAIGTGGDEVSGLVPDGVARVRLIRGGESGEADVRDNWFATSDAPSSPRFVEWLAADGSLVKRTDLNDARSR